MKTRSCTISQNMATVQLPIRKLPKLRRTSFKRFPATMLYTISRQMRRSNKMESVSRSSILPRPVIKHQSRTPSNSATSRPISKSNSTFPQTKLNGLVKVIQEDRSRPNRVAARLNRTRLIQVTGTRRALATTKINRMAIRITEGSMIVNRDPLPQSTRPVVPTDRAAVTTTLITRASMRVILRATLAEMQSQVCRLRSTSFSLATSARNVRAPSKIIPRRTCIKRVLSPIMAKVREETRTHRCIIIKALTLTGMVRLPSGHRQLDLAEAIQRRNEATQPAHLHIICRMATPSSWCKGPTATHGPARQRRVIKNRLRTGETLQTSSSPVAATQPKQTAIKHCSTMP